MSKHALIVLVFLVACASRCAAVPGWTSPNHYRSLVTVNMRSVTRTNSPVSFDIDLVQALQSMGAIGTFDEDTIEVVAYDSTGQAVAFDTSRSGYERYLLPWRIEKYYRLNKVTLHFVIPSSAYTQYAVYFDTKESGLGKPQRYRGLVGDGDFFCQSYGRREINGYDADFWVDLDKDGDLDIIKGSAEPYVFCYENVGEGKFVDRGRLTSGGSLLQFPVVTADGNRVFSHLTFGDWDGDGDQDMIVSFVAGAYQGHVMRYENQTVGNGNFNFVFRGDVLTNTGKSLYGTSGMVFVDWDNDTDLDLLVAKDGCITYHRNVGTKTSPVYADGTYLQANGVTIVTWNPCPEVADIDSDGDIDLFVSTDPGRVYIFENVGTRTNPIFAQGRLMVVYTGGYEDGQSRVKVADFDGDGLLDMVLGRHWERTQYGEQDRVFGLLHKNVGTPTAPRFEARTAENGAPYIERFQPCDAVCQNSVRAVSWNNQGLKDLLASDTDGFVWYFKNLGNQKYPVFAPGVKVYAGGQPVHVNGEEDRRTYAGYARSCVTDWNEDGRQDLLVASGGGWLWLYLNQGTTANPNFAAGTRVCAKSASGTSSYPIDGTSRASVLVCDWDNDGKKDVIFAMAGEGNPSQFYNWPAINANQSMDRGYLFYKNTGTNASPVLAYPKWLKAGGSSTIIDYTRPSMGSFIDWNSDGIKDFIGSEFEANIRYYRNTSSGAAGVEPTFTSSYDGIKVVSPYSIQTMSAADAIDFNGDGDIDIMTGMGHGGSYLRFYERDYCNDYVNNTYPTAALGASSRGLSFMDIRGMTNGQAVTLVQAVVTGVFNGFFYVETHDRIGGIKVEMANPGVSEGQTIDVTGTLSISATGERRIVATQIVQNMF